MSEHEPQITVIGPDTRIRGEMTFERTARVLGTLEGKVTTAGELQIGSSAQCRATLEAGTLIIDGAVEGDVVGHERVQLNGSARVDGDIVAERLIVAEGATFSGHCRVGPEAVKAAKTLEDRPARQTEPKPAITSSGPKFDWVGQPKPADTQAQSGWGPTGRAAGGAA